jgi:hypothetical protein
MRNRRAPAAITGRSRLTRIAVTIGVAAAVAAGGLAAAAPASAALGCPSGAHCLYAEFGGARYVLTASDPDLSDNFYPNGEPVVNNVAVVANSSTAGLESHYYQGKNYPTSGFLFCLRPGGSATVPPSLGNRIGSVRLRPRTSAPCL